MSRHWSQTPTERYIHTDYGVHDYQEIVERLGRIVAGNATELDKKVLAAVIRVVFGKRPSGNPS